VPSCADRFADCYPRWNRLLRCRGFPFNQPLKPTNYPSDLSASTEEGKIEDCSAVFGLARSRLNFTLLCYSRFVLKTLTSICIAAGLPLPVDGPRAADRLAAATSTKLRTGRCGYRGLVVPKRCIGCWLSGCRIGCLNAVPVGSVFAGSRSGACTCWKRNYRLRCQNTVPVRKRRAAPVARLPVDPLATSQSGHRVLFHIQA
jgi:hypothetical protein